MTLIQKVILVRCFLIEVAPDQEPVLGQDPELGTDEQQLKAVAWRPLDEVRHDLQVARVLEALERSHR